MAQKIESTETGAKQAGLPEGFELLPPVSMDDLKKNIEHDPEGAEEFVALMRSLRHQGSRPVSL